MALTDEGFYVSASFWATVAGVVVAVAAIWVGWWAANPKRRLRYGMPVVTPLLNAAPDAPPGIEVRRGGRVLTDPHVVEMRLVNEGRRDIPSAAFDQHRPLTLDAGAPIVEILKTISSPEREVPVTVQGTSVEIGPTLIVRRQEIALSLLVDGAAPRLTCPQPPLIDIDVRYGEPATSMRRRRRWWTATLGATLVVTLAVNLGVSSLLSETPPSITVASANFPENGLLAEVYAQALQAKGYRVVRRFGIGSRVSYLDQLKSGSIGVVPEYNGALAAFVDESADTTNSAEVASVLRRKLPPRLEALTPAAAEDKDSVTVNKRTADRYHLRTIDDLRPVQSKIAIGGPAEFQTREQGLPGLHDRYHLDLRFTPFLEGDRGTLVQQLKNNVIQAADLFTTEPTIDQNRFVVLADPKHLFGAQNVTPLVYRPALSPTARAALNAVSTHLRTEDLRFMNLRVSISHVDTTVVAKQWLRQTGLIR